MACADQTQRLGTAPCRSYVVGMKPKAERRNCSKLSADSKGEVAVPAVGTRRGPLQRETHGLRERLALRKGVGPRKRERPNIGFVRGVGPIALVFHLVD